MIFIELEFNKKYKYQQLCSIFQLEVKRGSAQRTQISKLKEKYDIEKDNGFYIINREWGEFTQITL